MAKRITALKCPQCGSVKKQSIKDDHYICNHCSTEYFLDNDDINVNVNHRHIGTSPHSFTPVTKKTVSGIIAAAAIFLAFMMSNLLVGKNSKSSFAEETYSDRPQDQMIYNDADGNLKVLFSVKRTHSGFNKKEDEFLTLFYDPVKNKIISEQKQGQFWGNTRILQYKKFSDGSLYIMPLNAHHLYKLDLQNHKLVDLTTKMFEGKAELGPGVATIKFVSDGMGDGFQIMSNDGKEYYYYPIAGKLYNDRTVLTNDSKELSTLPPGALEKTYYIFTEKSFDYPDEPIQLLQYHYIEKPGYPIRLPYGARWQNVRDYRYSKYVTYKSPFDSYNVRVSKYKDLTPGRMYFSPSIEYQDENRVFIKTMPDANPESTPLLQKIDVNTGKVVWTYSPEAHKAKFDYISVAKDAVGFELYTFGSTNIRKYIILKEDDGSLIKEFDLNNLELK